MKSKPRTKPQPVMFRLARRQPRKVSAVRYDPELDVNVVDAGGETVPYVLTVAGAEAVKTYGHSGGED